MSLLDDLIQQDTERRFLTKAQRRAVISAHNALEAYKRDNDANFRDYQDLLDRHDALAKELTELKHRPVLRLPLPETKEEMETYILEVVARRASILRRREMADKPLWGASEEDVQLESPLLALQRVIDVARRNTLLQDDHDAIDLVQRELDTAKEDR